MSETHRFTTHRAPVGLLDRVRPMLAEAFGERFSEHDWDHAMGGRHIVVTDGENVVAHGSVVSRTLWVGDRRFDVGYLEAVATAPARQGEGIGARVVAELTQRVRDDFELGALATGRHQFYEHLGWERWTGPTLVRHPTGDVRTEKEDDGVMVLRHGPSAEIDLRGAIVCEPRSGSAW